MHILLVLQPYVLVEMFGRCLMGYQLAASCMWVGAFGGLAIALVFGISSYIGVPSSRNNLCVGGVGAYPGIGLM